MTLHTKNIVIDNNSYNNKFFKEFPHYSEQVKKQIYDNIVEMIENMPHKIKPVRGYKYKNKTIEEYKIIIDKTFKCRIAYIIDEENIEVFFISTTLIKAKFTALVAKVDGVSKINN